MTCPCSSCVAFATRWRAPWRIVWTAFLNILSHIGLLRPSPAGPGTPMLLPETIVTHTSPAMPGDPVLPEAMTTSHEKCWEDSHFCFAYAPKCSKDCAQCGIPFPCGTMQASMRGTGHVRQLVAFAFGSPVWTRSWNGTPATTMHVYEMSTTICECARFLQSNSGITWHGPGTLDLSVTCDRAGGRSLRSQ